MNNIELLLPKKITDFDKFKKEIRNIEYAIITIDMQYLEHLKSKHNEDENINMPKEPNYMYRITISKNKDRNYKFELFLNDEVPPKLIGFGEIKSEELMAKSPKIHMNFS